ncbi:MAG: potassium channel family protein [Longimicrobiales bacterium]
MKFLSGHLAYALRDEQLRRNVGGLAKYVLFLVTVVAVYSVLFHVIMLQVEGQEHSWVTGIYWTLTVMSTLGFGDITFTSDIGRAFSVLVLVSGIILLLIVLPFAFIRYFYAPWLETRLRLRAPREAPSDVEDHVILCDWDSLARELATQLDEQGIPWLVLAEDAQTATEMFGDGVSVMRGDVDDVDSYRRARVEGARLVLANRSDLLNTNVALTVREASSTVPILAIVEDEHSVDVLELSGCNRVVPLKRRLGEHLANRVDGGHSQAHVIGHYRDLVVAEFSIHGTPLAGRTIGGSKLREIAGVSVAGVWERGRMHPPDPQLVLEDSSLPVVVGSDDAIQKLNEFLHIYDTNLNPVVVIGGGKVGRAATRALKDRSLPVHLVERDPGLAEVIGDLPDELFIGDAADRRVMDRVGLDRAPSVLLSTNQDATNIYLASYCRRLNPEVRIVSRITHERNLAAIQRAGADLVLSYTTLGVETVLSFLHGRPPVPLGEGIAFHLLKCPEELIGRTLGEAGVGERTGLTVVGIERNEHFLTDPGADTRIEEESVLLTIGSDEQVGEFQKLYG